MSDTKVILFDLPSKGKSYCWSANAWKGRLALNYKGIPYETRWVEYPDIAPLFKSFGIAPNSAGMQYTIPAIQMPDGRFIMDSVKIAQELDMHQPSPSLRLGSPRVEQTKEAVELVNNALAPVSRPRVPEMVLNSGSIEYFSRTRSQRFGMPLEVLARSELAGEAAWKGATEGLERVKSLLAEDKTGPYVMGAEPGFADFVLAGFWRFMQVLDRQEDLFGRLMKYDESFPKHFTACKKWLLKDD